jgi:hypothetical protein
MESTATHHGVGFATHEANHCSRGAVIAMGTQVAHTTNVLLARSSSASQMTEDLIWTILSVIAVFQVGGKPPGRQSGYREGYIMSAVGAAVLSTLLCMVSAAN